MSRLRARALQARKQAKPTLDLSDLGSLTESAGAARLTELLRNPRWSPPELPAMAPRLVQMAQRPNVSISEVVRVLEQDMGLSARVIQVVRSPLYLTRTPVQSLSQAVIRLGLNTLRNVVLEAGLASNVFAGGSYVGATMERLRRHSSMVAFVCRAVASHVGASVAHVVDGEQAFMCGLLHDVGVAAILIVMETLPPERRPPLLTAALPAIGLVHERASKVLARKWRFPNDLAEVVGGHHQGPKGQSTTDCLRAIIAVADRITQDMGESWDEGFHDETAPEPTSRAIDLLGLTRDSLELLYLEAEEIRDNLSAHLRALA